MPVSLGHLPCYSLHYLLGLVGIPGFPFPAEVFVGMVGIPEALSVSPEAPLLVCSLSLGFSMFEFEGDPG